MFPNTPSQRWAASKGACGRGRRRLGKLSIGQYWKSTPNHGNRAFDLLWILNALARRDANDYLPEGINRLGNLNRPSVADIRQAAIDHNVSIPLELL